MALLNVVRIRTDKLEPNDRLTIERTLVNIKENITQQELVYKLS